MKPASLILTGLLLAGCIPGTETPSPRPPLTKTVPGVTQSATATSTPAQPPTDTPAPVEDPVLVGAGDIAYCGGEGDDVTASLLDAIPGTVYTTGDNAYPSGTAQEFADCYGPSWGRHRDRTFPSLGNHDYGVVGAAGYFDYFGERAGTPGEGYYSYDLGGWHIIALNSIIQVSAGSAQEQWLRSDLAAHPAVCTLAYWHYPLFSSGSVHGGDPAMRPLWQALYDHRADVVLAGHEHHYERFAPQDPQGNADPVRGMREFVVGSGGRSHYGFGAPVANSEVRNGDTYGLLKLTLHPSSYSWEFIPEPGKTFTDSGNAACVP